MKNKKYVVIRTYSAGNHAGFLESHRGKEVILTDARRLWRWFSRLSLTDLAVEGTPDALKCKFSVEAPRITLTEVIEIIETTEIGEKSIRGVKACNS